MSAASTPSHEMSDGDERRTDADRGEPEHLDDAENPRENLVRNRALNERQPGDVDERASDAHDARRATIGDRRRSCQSPRAMSGRPISDDPEQEGRAQSPRAGEREGGDRADERADPDRRVEVADAAVAEVEQLRCAVTTMNTWTAPKTAVCAVSSTIITRRARFRAERREAREALGRDRRGLELAARRLRAIDVG